MPKIFERVQTRKKKYSSFDLSHEQKLTCNMGQLVPTYFQEILPGDQFRVKSETLVRLAPMVAPIMHRVNVYMHYFFVPNRIVWSEWEDFITGGKDGTSSPVLPQLAIFNPGNYPLADYLGIPSVTGADHAIEFNALPFRAYHKIWNDYYRDETLQDELDIETATPAELLELKYRCWEKDYFTSALPWAQRGPEVGVPIEPQYLDQSEVYTSSGGNPTGGLQLKTQTGADTAKLVDELNDPLRIENLDSSVFDMSINQLRTSSALQRFYEKQARGGYRYIETLLQHFDQKLPDLRLQRPQYLGGGRQPIVISEVLNTTGTSNAPQGDMAGHGVSLGTTNSFSQKFNEHGYVIGIMSIMPKPNYMQGIDRTFLRTNKEDYFWPDFANIGEQEIKNKELYLDPTDSDYNEQTFGYQQRYAEYKYKPSTVHGEFRDTLDHWTIVRKFGSQPQLNAEFVQYPKNNPPDQKIFAVETGDKLWIQLYHDVKARRQMPYFSDPSLR